MRARYQFQKPFKLEPVSLMISCRPHNWYCLPNNRLNDVLFWFLLTFARYLNLRELSQQKVNRDQHWTTMNDICKLWLKFAPRWASPWWSRAECLPGQSRLVQTSSSCPAPPPPTASSRARTTPASKSVPVKLSWFFWHFHTYLFVHRPKCWSRLLWHAVTNSEPSHLKNLQKTFKLIHN